MMQIQYLGFQLKPQGRDYLYLVVNQKTEKREFTFTISNQSFVQKRMPYQDAADLCYQKLRRELDLETPEQPVPSHSTLTNQELQEYLEKHRPPKRRTW
ncbi:MAG: hypothetical protein ACM3NO_09420 [Deltaproteobacteria bacterium]